MARRGHDAEGARLKVVISSAFEFTTFAPVAGCTRSMGAGSRDGSSLALGDRSQDFRDGRDTSRSSQAVISITSACPGDDANLKHR